MEKEALVASLDTLDKWLIVFGVLVAIGVVGESVVGFLHWRKSGQLQAIQTQENLALQKQVLDARTEFEKYKAPRNLGDQQQLALLGKLKAFPATPFATSVIPGDPEAMALQRLLAYTLKKSGWNWEPWSPPSAGLAFVFTTPGEPNVGQSGGVGVQVILDPTHADQLWPATHAFVDVLNAEGIAANAQAVDAPAIHNKAVINILVGKKPQ